MSEGVAKDTKPEEKVVMMNLVMIKSAVLYGDDSVIVKSSKGEKEGYRKDTVIVRPAADKRRKTAPFFLSTCDYSQTP